MPNNQIKEILILAHRYARARRIAPSTLSRRANQSSTWLDRCATGNVTIRSAIAFVQWLSNNWPFGLEWPSGIDRPEPERHSPARGCSALPTWVATEQSAEQEGGNGPSDAHGADKRGPAALRLVVVQPDRNGCYSGTRGITFTLGGDGSEILRGPPQGEERDELTRLVKTGREAALPSAECTDSAVGRPGEHGPGQRDTEIGEQVGVTPQTVEKVRKRCVQDGIAATLERRKRKSRAGNGAGWRRRGAVGRHRL